MVQRSFLRNLGTAACAVLLAGCATSYVVDNTVQSFSSLPALPAAPTYRFERLPSQQDPGQAQLEAVADAALHQAGLRRDDRGPRYSVQVTGRTQRMLSPFADPWDYGWGGWGGWGWGRRGGGRIGLWGTMESPWYHREVGVVVRDLSANRVVFESRASNDGPWTDGNVVFPAMFQAALQGFPQPPAGPRRVDITIGQQQAQAPAPAPVPAPAPARP